jgi:hypothetical protein
MSPNVVIHHDFLPCELLITYYLTIVGSPKDAGFLNTPTTNYNEMQTIFVLCLTTGKYIMSSSEPLAMSPAAPSVEDADTHESDTVILDGAP